MQLFAPFGFVILVWGLSKLPQALEDDLDPPVEHVESFPRCVVCVCVCVCVWVLSVLNILVYVGSLWSIDDKEPATINSR